MFFTGCPPVQWPGKTQAGVYFTPNLLASGPSGPYTWFGTLAENGGGSTGMLFRRNRYFDPVSGRFTQQDPIGVAGGMNLYGFADGDPVNFSDPFGLCVGPLAAACAWVFANLPTATVVAAEAGTGLALAGGGGRLTGGALRQAGKVGEAAVEAGLLAEGATIIGRQVSARTSAGRRVIDFLVQRADETLVAIEAKSGRAVRTASQVLKDQRMASEGAVLVGKNAPEALRNKPLPPILTELRRP